MRQVLWIFLWLSLSLNVIYFVETEISRRPPVEIFLASVREITNFLYFVIMS